MDIDELIYAYAGHAQCDPAGKTLRELAWMAEAVWSKTARLEAAIRDGLTPRKDKKPWEPKMFNPFAKQDTTRQSLTPDDVRRIANSCKRVRKVLASEVKVRE